MDLIPSKVTWLRNVGADQVIKTFLASDLAIVPASGILFEALACKTPSISGYYTTNQMDIYNGFKGMGVFVDCADFSAEKIAGALDFALTNDLAALIQRMEGTIDGLAAERYRDAFTSLINPIENS
jgi:3-deoxy-D-manno-octulosonic-acid transferase